MMDCLCGAPRQVQCRVVLLDETDFNHELQDDSLGQSLLDAVFERLNLLETAYFGLRYLDENDQTHWLDPAKKLSKQMRRTLDQFVFYFGVKFYAADPCKLLEEITRYQLFLQVKQDILRGRLPVSFDLAAELGAYIVQSELGDYDPRRHSPGYVSEFRFLSNQTQELESRISELHKSLAGQVPSQAELSYLDKVKWLDMYGVDLHPVLGEDNVEYFLGLTPSGIIVLRSKHTVANYYWPRIAKIYFKGKYFMLRVCDKNNECSTYGFETPSKAACKHLWRCCVEHHAFFRLVVVSPTTPDIFALGSRFRYSGRTERQAVKDAQAQWRTPPVFNRTPSRRQQRRIVEGAVDAPKIEETKQTNEIKQISIPQPAISLESPYRSTCSIPASLGTSVSASNRPRTSGGADSPRSTRSAPWTQPHTARGLFGPAPPSPRSVRSGRSSATATGHGRHYSTSGHDSRHRSSSVDSQSSNDSRSCRRHRHRSRRTSDNDSELSRSSGRSHRKHRRHRSRHKHNESGSENDSKHSKTRSRRHSTTNYELVDSESQWLEVQRKQQESGAMVQQAAIRKSGQTSNNDHSTSTANSNVNGRHYHHQNSTSKSQNDSEHSGYHTGGRSRRHKNKHDGSVERESGRKPWPGELTKHLEWELVDTSGMTEEQRREIPYTVVQTNHSRIRVRAKHSSIKEEPAIISPNNSPEKQISNNLTNLQQSKIEYQNSAGGSIRSSSTISSTERSNKSATVQNIEQRLPRMMNSLSMNEFQSGSPGQQQQHRLCSAQVSSSASSFSLTSGAAGVASCIGGIASGTAGRSTSCVPGHGGGGTLGSAGGHSSSGESGAALRVSHEHTDSGLGAEQDYAYSSERSSDSAKYASNAASGSGSPNVSTIPRRPLSTAEVGQIHPQQQKSTITENNTTSSVHSSSYSTTTPNLHNYNNNNNNNNYYSYSHNRRIQNGSSNNYAYSNNFKKHDTVSDDYHYRHQQQGSLSKKHWTQNQKLHNFASGNVTAYNGGGGTLDNRRHGSKHRANATGPLLYVEANGNSVFAELEERRNKNAASFISQQQRCDSALSQRSSHSLYSPARLNDLRNAPGPRSASLEMILEPLIQSTQGQSH